MAHVVPFMEVFVGPESALRPPMDRINVVLVDAACGLLVQCVSSGRYSRSLLKLVGWNAERDFRFLESLPL